MRGWVALPALDSTSDLVSIVVSIDSAILLKTAERREQVVQDEGVGRSNLHRPKIQQIQPKSRKSFIQKDSRLPWAWVDSNYRPHAYQACALTS